jgi:hypothetical protein
MAMPDEPYYTLIVETYRESGSGLHGDIHVRCVRGQEFPQSLRTFTEKDASQLPRRNPIPNLCEADR